jgi:hypothetical protein
LDGAGRLIRDGSNRTPSRTVVEPVLGVTKALAASGTDAGVR